MRYLLLSTLLPVLAWATQSPLVNPGSIIGINAMCGANPVDCHNGWCCQQGQTCTTSSGKVMCNDPTLIEFSTGKASVLVNAALVSASANQNSTVASSTATGSVPSSSVQINGASGPNTYWTLLAALAGSSLAIYGIA